MAALRRGALGLRKSLSPGIDVAFPYYGDVLHRFAEAYDLPLTLDAQARGGEIDLEFLTFQAQVAEALRQRAGISDSEINTEYGDNPKPRGPENWEWVQAILRALDGYGGGMSAAAIERFTRDVFLYTTRAGVRDEIDWIVANALTEEPTVVVGHSLGSVIAYNVLRSDRRRLQIPLLVTLGCPLGIRPIRDQLVPLRFPASVSAWYNAYDDRDLVALYPLDGTSFPVKPEIENYGNVENHTENHHGIDGYLDHRTVAERVLAALGT